MKWKIIKDFPDYLISDCGLVKSQQRLVERNLNGKVHLKTINERILKPSLRNGYLFVTLRKNNSHKANMIHQMVASAFIGKRREVLVINHKDGNKLNNSADNLEYVSKQRNTQHFYQMIGKSSGKIPISHIPEIIDRISNGEACYKIAKEYNVSRNDIAVISKIISLTGQELTINLK
jgi:hypothetical protein